jgi:hypothetical protein
VTSEQIKTAARQIRLWRREHRRPDGAGFLDALSEISLDGSSLSKEQRLALEDARRNDPTPFKPGPGDDPPPDYAVGICDSIDELDEMGKARKLPEDIQALWDAEEAERLRELAEHDAAEARLKILERLGTAAGLYRWLEVQGAMVSRKQISQYFGKSERMVRYWLEGLKAAGVLQEDRTDYHKPLFGLRNDIGLPDRSGSGHVA